MYTLRILALSLSILAGTACSYVNTSTLARLTTLSPLEADPADFTVFISLPNDINLVPGSAKLTLQADRADTGEAFAETYILDEKRSEVGDQIYRIAPEDIPDLRTNQALARAWEAEAPEATSGTLSFTLEACKTVDTPDLNGVIQVDLSIAEDGPRMPLISDLPLSLYETQAERGKIRPCP